MQQQKSRNVTNICVAVATPLLVGITMYKVMSDTIDQLAFNNNPDWKLCEVECEAQILSTYQQRK